MIGKAVSQSLSGNESKQQNKETKTMRMPRSHLAVGRNLLTVRCRRSNGPDAPVTLEKAEVHVAYRRGPAGGSPGP